MFAPITKVNEGESNTPCPSTLEVTYSSVEKLSKALHWLFLSSGGWASPLPYGTDRTLLIYHPPRESQSDIQNLPFPIAVRATRLIVESRNETVVC
jgi:hypothetical protein